MGVSVIRARIRVVYLMGIIPECAAPEVDKIGQAGGVGMWDGRGIQSPRRSDQQSRQDLANFGRCGVMDDLPFLGLGESRRPTKLCSPGSHADAAPTMLRAVAARKPVIEDGCAGGQAGEILRKRAFVDLLACPKRH